MHTSVEKERSLMQDFGKYFSWPLFIIRLAFVIATLPVMLIISMFLACIWYFEDRKAYRNTSFLSCFSCSFQVVFISVGLFLLGGHQTLKGNKHVK